MKKYYVTGQIAFLDVGAEVEAENPFMAAIKFKKTYEPSLHFRVHSLHVLEVEEDLKNETNWIVN